MIWRSWVQTPSRVELEVHGTSALSHTWTKSTLLIVRFHEQTYNSYLYCTCSFYRSSESADDYGEHGVCVLHVDGRAWSAAERDANRTPDPAHSRHVGPTCRRHGRHGTYHLSKVRNCSVWLTDWLTEKTLFGTNCSVCDCFMTDWLNEKTLFGTKCSVWTFSDQLIEWEDFIRH